MILEVAPLRITAGQSEAFEAAFREAQDIISSMPGHISHELHRCLERSNDPFPTALHFEAVEGASGA